MMKNSLSGTVSSLGEHSKTICVSLQIRISEEEWGVPHSFTLFGRQTVVVAARYTHIQLNKTRLAIFCDIIKTKNSILFYVMSSFGLWYSLLHYTATS